MNMNRSFHKIFPEKTDHGGYGFGDVAIFALDAVLLLYTAWRSWDLLNYSVPSGWQALALAGLGGLDLGMIGWSLAWVYGSTTKYQDWLTFAVWLVDAVGVVLTGLADSLLYSPTMQVTEGMRATIMTLAWFGIPVIVAANALGGVVYHFFLSPQALLKRKERKMRYALKAQKMEFDLQAEDEEMKAAFAREVVLKRRQLLRTYEEVARLAAEQARAEEAILRRLEAIPLAPSLGNAVLQQLTPQKDEGQATDEPAPRVAASVVSDNGAHPSPTHYTQLDLSEGEE